MMLFTESTETDLTISKPDPPNIVLQIKFPAELNFATKPSYKPSCVSSKLFKTGKLSDVVYPVTTILSSESIAMEKAAS